MTRCRLNLEGIKNVEAYVDGYGSKEWEFTLLSGHVVYGDGPRTYTIFFRHNNEQLCLSVHQGILDKLKVGTYDQPVETLVW